MLNEVWCFLHAHYAVVVPNSLMSLFCQVFQHGHRMGWVSLAHSLFPHCATLMSLTILMDDIQFASLYAERTSVVRRSFFVCPISPFRFGSRYFGDVSSLRCCERVHFIWSSAFTVLFCMVCDIHSCRFCCL